MVILYDLIFLVIVIVYLPIYLAKRKFYRDFLLRLGVLPKNLTLFSRPIWIHAVSVGEAMAIRGLLEELRIAYPDKQFVISTVTPAGNKIVKSITKEQDCVTYLPLDFSFIIGKVIGKINPAIFIIAETELWPNLTTCLYKKNIPIVVVNGRISDASFKGYLAIRPLTKLILNKINLFCVQTERDKQRLVRLGVDKNKVKITGNMKFDAKSYLNFKENDRELKSKLRLSGEDRLLVAASTHAGEEEIILEAYKNLLKEYPHLKLLIAARHPQRTSQIEKVITAKKLKVYRVSEASEDNNSPDVFILDTIGQLLSFYSIADIVFVGGSLVKIGGHNILEPAALAKPILFGPQMFNFRDIADLFLTHQAALIVHNQQELETKIAFLLNNPSQREELGQRAKALILANQGVSRKNVVLIKEVLAGYG
jgi:3-deoxy-D-manno-octulosonic-acid transferase